MQVMQDYASTGPDNRWLSPDACWKHWDTAGAQVQPHFRSARDRIIATRPIVSRCPLRYMLYRTRFMCKLLHMPTNLAIDDRLLEEARKAGGHKTKKDTVNEALREYIQRRKQVEMLDLFGKVDFDPNYDYKRQRKRR